MKNLSILIALFFATSISFAQKSPRVQTDGTVNGIQIAIDYGAPSVKGRTIWGGLEKYGAVWRAGANENTTVSFDKEVTISGKKLAAGKYGFYIIPNKDNNWVIIFSKKNDAWGAYSYSKSDDALRLKIQPEWVNDVQEQLMYAVDNSGIVFAWEKARIKIPVE